MIVRPIAGDAERRAAYALRIEVFCDEQGVSREAEMDGRDAGALHLVALAPDVVGTCRLLDEGATVAVGRVAVRRDRRRSGVGSLLLDEAERQARRRGATAIELHAQLQSEDFYARAGYARVGKPYLEEGIEHVTMRRSL